MQALQIIKLNGNYRESVQYGEMEKPELKGPNDVLVRVKAAGVNPVDAKVAKGNISAAKLVISFPAVIGGDFAGVVEQVGSQVKDFQVGDEVFGSHQMPFGLKGSFAQYTVVDTTKASIAKKPSHLSFESAATAGIAFLTAYQGIVIHGRIQEDKKKTVLVIGASGGVGGFGVQITKALSADSHVIAICSAKNTAYVTSLGADEVVPYDQPSEYEAFLKRAVGSIDVVFDTVGGDDYFNQTDPLLKKKGVYCSAVGPVKHAGSEALGFLSLASLVSKVVSKKLFSKHEYCMITSLPHNKFRTDVATLFASEAINKDVDEENIIPLSEGYKAFENLMTHRVTGKIVFRVD